MIYSQVHYSLPTFFMTLGGPCLWKPFKPLPWASAQLAHA